MNANQLRKAQNHQLFMVWFIISTCAMLGVISGFWGAYKILEQKYFDAILLLAAPTITPIVICVRYWLKSRKPIEPINGETTP